jgi:ferric-dicitrate binding protein FerR (iron transport regulator)
MSRPDPTAEKEALVQAYVEGHLTPEESARLRELVRQDPLLARVIADHLRTDAAIREIVGEKEPSLAPGPAPSLPGASDPPPHKSSRRIHIVRPRRSGPERSVFFAVAAAAAGVLFLIGLALHHSSKGPKSSDESVRRELERVAELRRQIAERDIRQAEEARRQAEKRLQEIARREAELKAPSPQPVPDPAVEEKRKDEIADLSREKERIESEMRQAIEKARRAQAELAAIPARPAAEAPPAPGPKPEEPRPTVVETSAAVARVESVEKEVYLVSESGRAPLKGPADLLPGQSLETAGPAGRAVLSFRDKTRVDLGADTLVGRVREDGGKRIRLERGSVWADVDKQAPERPMIFETPFGDVKVLGTSLRIAVDLDRGGSTYVEVLEGKVELTRKPDGAAVLVTSGHSAVAAAGVTLATRPIRESIPEIVLKEQGFVVVNFGPAGLRLPDKVVNDAAAPFDREMGYGWQGKVWVATSPGSLAQTDPMKASYVGGGSANDTATWRLRVPNGAYVVTACVGGVGAGVPDQGHHHVAVEGKQLIDAVLTTNGRFEERSMPVTVTDGELTMVVGGHKRKAVTSDNSDDTVLNYVVIRRAKK